MPPLQPPPPPPTGGGAAVSEEYRKLIDKAYLQFARLRELPAFGRGAGSLQFQKAFRTYSRLWKFQQEHRQRLVESGLRRWEVGEIASRIGQLYYNYYVRTSEASYLFEAYIFYEAIASREYFKDGGGGGGRGDASLAHKQLRYHARFIVVCLLLNRREAARRLLRHLRLLVEDYARMYQLLSPLPPVLERQAADARDWKVVVQEVLRFMKADALCDGTRTLRCCPLLDLEPAVAAAAALPASSGSSSLPVSRTLQEAVLTSYHHNEVKFSELTLDTFRMLQTIEWEPSGSFYRGPGAATTSTGDGALPGTAAKARGVDDNLVDASVPANPHKYILYRPSVPQLLLAMATACKELQPDAIMLVYISASGIAPRQAAFPDAMNMMSSVSSSQLGEGDAAKAAHGPTTPAQLEASSAESVEEESLAVEALPSGIGDLSVDRELLDSHLDASALEVGPSRTAAKRSTALLIPSLGSEPLPHGDAVGGPETRLDAELLEPAEASESSTPQTSPGSSVQYPTPPPLPGALDLHTALAEDQDGCGGSIGGGGGSANSGEVGAKGGLPGLWLGAKRESVAPRPRDGWRSAQQHSCAGDSYLLPSDLLPFTRRPLLLIVDSESSAAFEAISGEERGEPAALLLSAVLQPVNLRRTGSGREHVPTGGNLFTLFLSAPLLAFCQLSKISILGMPPGAYEAAERQLTAVLRSWHAELAACADLAPPWRALLGDPFLARLLMRFAFARAALGLHTHYCQNADYLPRCLPSLPPHMLPASELVASGVYGLADSLGAGQLFLLYRG
eukprot:SM000040S14811  [mRNA]  locus=s40:550251:554668:+ [translate_table: standard]